MGYFKLIVGVGTTSLFKYANVLLTNNKIRQNNKILVDISTKSVLN